MYPPRVAFGPRTAALLAAARRIGGAVDLLARRGRRRWSLRTRRRCTGRHALTGIGARRCGRRCLRGVLGGRRRAGLIDRGVVQAIENRTQHERDGDGEHRDLGPAGGTLGELGIRLQLIVEASLATEVIVAEVGAIGIVRKAFVRHGGVPPLFLTIAWEGLGS